MVGQEVSGSLFGAYISKKVHYIQGVSTKDITVHDDATVVIK